MYGDKRQMESSRYHKACVLMNTVPRKRNHLGTISGIILCVLVAVFIVALIGYCPF